jgi:hypothetical protein
LAERVILGVASEKRTSNNETLSQEPGERFHVTVLERHPENKENVHMRR